MPITNPTFELCPTPETPWIATGWTYSASTACRVAGFGLYQEPLESFAWAEFSTDTAGWVPALFDRWSRLYEMFDFGGLVDEWSPGWLTSTGDAFEWAGWDPVFHPGAEYGPDAFDWSSFSDSFVPGLVCYFDAGANEWEGFESW